MMIANTASNLDGYASPKSDFHKLFSIDSDYLKAVKEKLDAAGAQNYELLVLFGNIKEYLEVIDNSNLDCLDPRYVGSHWGENNNIVSSLIKHESSQLNIHNLIGKWKNGDKLLEIQIRRYNSIIILDDRKEVWAVAKEYADGYLFAFVQSHTLEAQILNAVEENGVLYFSNDYSWIKQ